MPFKELLTTLLLAVFSKRNESTVVIDTCGVTDSFLWRDEIERLGTVQVAHILIVKRAGLVGRERLEYKIPVLNPEYLQPRPQGAFPWLWRWGAPGKCVLGTRLEYLLPSPWVLSLAPTGLLRDGPNGCLHCTLHQSMAQNQRS